MTYYGKSHSEVIAAGRARQAELAQREQRFAERARRKLRRAQLGCSTLSASGLLVSGWAFALPAWLLPLLIPVAACGPWLAVRLQAGIVLGLALGGFASGIPGILLVFLLGMLASGGGGNLAGAMGQLLVLFFMGLGFPLIAGGLCGYLRQTIDDEHVQL